MPLPVQLIFKETPGSLPATEVIGASVELEFAASRVRVDGALASATFVPVLEVLDQAGNIIAQARPDQEFAVGDTGAVTYAPF